MKKVSPKKYQWCRNISGREEEENQPFLKTFTFKKHYNNLKNNFIF